MAIDEDDVRRKKKKNQRAANRHGGCHTTRGGEGDGAQSGCASPSFGELSWRLDADLEMVAGRGSINA